MTTEMTAHDRCDRCGAQAFVETAHQKSNLLWCFHHYKEHKDILLSQVIRENLAALEPVKYVPEPETV